MKAIRKAELNEKVDQSNLYAFQKIDKLLKKHSQIQDEDHQNSERPKLQKLKNQNDGL